jgi:catechol 2,3-dioxygenase-like lactoylglutathione lyase family enzyme
MLDSDLDLGHGLSPGTDGSRKMIKPHSTNTEFDLDGINHVALVCSDMARTVDFYSNVLGMPLVKSLDLPGGAGQHFFFDAGNGDCVAFFWFADAPDRVPGISSPVAIPGIGDITSAVSTMNHLAFHVPAEKFADYRQRLKDKGVRVGPVLNHDESERQVSATVHPGVYVRSFYFQDPDGITLEFACWVKEFTEGGARAVPKNASDRRPPAEVAR